MNKQEIIEAINSTIMPNGQKGITAEALANILIEMANASGSGEGYVTVYMGSVDMTTNNYVQSEEEKALNAEAFLKIKAGARLVVIDASDFYASQLGATAIMSATSEMTVYLTAEAAEMMGLSSECVFMGSGTGELILMPDGTIEIAPAE